MRRILPTLWWMTDSRRTPDPAAEIRRLPRGSAVVLRHYDDPGRDRLAQTLSRLCRVRGLVFVVAGSWRLAAAVGAQGLHLPESAAARGLEPGGRLWRRQKGRLLTAAAHSPRGLCCARAISADAAFLSPIFPTASHPGRPALGMVRAAAMLRSIKLPVMALGGVKTGKKSALKRAGFAGLAGISLLQQKPQQNA